MSFLQTRDEKMECEESFKTEMETHSKLVALYKTNIAECQSRLAELEEASRQMKICFEQEKQELALHMEALTKEKQGLLNLLDQKESNIKNLEKAMEGYTFESVSGVDKCYAMRK